MVHKSLFVCLILGTFGCSSPSPSINDAMIAGLSTNEMEGINEARLARASANDNLGRAARETATFEQEIEVARLGLEVARLEVEKSKVGVAAAETGTHDQLRAATHNHDLKLAKADVARALLAMKKREYEWARMTERLNLEQVRMKDALLELAKAEAVSQSEMVEATRVPLVDFREQVNYHQEEVAHARERATAADQELGQARSDYEYAQNQVKMLEMRK